MRNIDFTKPQALLQHKLTQISEITGDTDFIFSVPEVDKDINSFRVFKNGVLLSKIDYDININTDEVTVILKEPSVVKDIIQLDVFLPLKYYNEKSTCILADYTYEFFTISNNLPLLTDYYNPSTCKIHIIEIGGRGYIPSSQFEVIGKRIQFNNIMFNVGCKLQIKIIQDGNLLV